MVTPAADPSESREVVADVVCELTHDVIRLRIERRIHGRSRRSPMPRDKTLEIVCPGCRRQSPYLLADVKEKTEVICPGCSHPFDARDDPFARAILAGLQSLERLRPGLERTLAKLIKPEK